MTREFLEAVKQHLKQDGILIVNMLSAPDFHDKFSMRYDRTFSAVFPVHARQSIGAPKKPFNPWPKAGGNNSDLVAWPGFVGPSKL
ncbi:MAG: hypothetical protein M3N08_05835 [Pseudomonadota bacterium]|nr:hypothetical protein [Pseudomonadota bacterium]